MNLDEATAQARTDVERIRTDVAAAGLQPSIIVTGDPAECTDELNRLNGTAEREVRFDVDVDGQSGVDALVKAVDGAVGGMQVRRSTDPETGRPLIVGTDGGRQVSLSFSVADGGRRATVTASTGCRPTS